VELGLVRHPLTDRPGPAIGVANVMTLYRGWAAVPILLLGLSTARPRLLWVVLCLSAGLTDLLDGSVAKALRQESRLGRLLDPVMDGLVFTAAAIGLVHWGLLPWWVGVVVALRYFIPVLGGMALILVRGRTLPLRHTPWGQRSTLAVGIALLVSWAASVVAVPWWGLAALYALALTTMGLAVGGIMRRVPPAPGAA
jgi:phosphatidylglycerophosphate synthase